MTTPAWWPVLGVALALLVGASLLYLAAESLGLGPSYWRTHDPGMRTSLRAAARIRHGWPRLARHLSLQLEDRTPTAADTFNGRNKSRQARITTPPIRRCVCDRHGVTLDIETIPTVGMRQIAAVSGDLANRWRMKRVTVRQPDSGMIRIRALHTDPLTEPAEATVPPRPASLETLFIGMSEAAEQVKLRLANSSGIGVFGTPGFGKSVFLRWLITRLAPSRAVQFVVFDGKTAAGLDGDYAELGPRLLAVVGDDMAEANALLRELVQMRRLRSSTIRQALGVTNLWEARTRDRNGRIITGPNEKWPLIVIVIDEAHTYFQTITGLASEDIRRRNALAAENVLLTEDLAKKGRSVAMVTVLATQKGTVDAIPSSIRDVLTAFVCFAVRTIQSAIAALGPSISDYPDANPVDLLKDEYRGVGVMAAEGMPGFLRFRNPFTSPAQAGAIAKATAHYVNPAALPTVTTGTGHRTAAADAPVALRAKRSPTPPPAPEPGPQPSEPPDPQPAEAPTPQREESTPKPVRSKTPPRPPRLRSMNGVRGQQHTPNPVSSSNDLDG
ncbi:FtsK/SpoIIIE domain-containing protein [Nocardia sp. 852002-51101_SCH5132738]|uniref:FtsK/SpoIIIE domain-containing protein n=1 Tax=Nocardia sp. 852002-51101_SCH5132738 TaxID=1834095 RepID=UPI000A794FD1|nr:FtsK/SpoIIIE domain-containing protein [Nocardia sp. 852002-51101_SCH5132738]